LIRCVEHHLLSTTPRKKLPRKKTNPPIIDCDEDCTQSVNSDGESIERDIPCSDGERTHSPDIVEFFSDNDQSHNPTSLDPVAVLSDGEPKSRTTTINNRRKSLTDVIVIDDNTNNSMPFSLYGRYGPVLHQDMNRRRTNGNIEYDGDVDSNNPNKKQKLIHPSFRKTC